MSDNQARDKIIAVKSARFLDERGLERIDYFPEEEMTAVILFSVLSPVENPLLRFQLFNHQNPEGLNTFIYGINTERRSIRPGWLSPGDWEARLHFTRLNLGPGEYKATLGLWPDEATPVPYAAHHGRYSFRIHGELDPTGAKAHIPLLWSAPTVAGVARNARDHLVDLVVQDRNGSEVSEHTTLESLTLQIDYHLRNPQLYSLRATLNHADGVAHRATYNSPLPGGQASIRLSYDPLTLLQGEYVAEVALVENLSQAPWSLQRARFSISTPREMGAGLVYLPCTWALEQRD